YDGKTQLSDGGTIQFSRLENDPDMRIGMSLPEGPVYAGQQVPITIRWSYAGDINAVQYAFANLQIRSPLFDQFRFKDEPARTQTTLTIATAKGNVEIGATVSKETLEGRESYVVTGQRTLIADKPSDYEAIPITCRTKKVVRWSRDLFGDLVAREDAPALAAGTPLTFTIKPLPLSNRPESFAGAVGSGFSIDVAADRSVVRVGDPITLTISVRGDGNLENVPLPQLSADNGLSPDVFQVPAEQPAGTFDGKTKEFKVTIRVKEPSVEQIPAIAFSWFDPVKESYGTGRSKPIALQVTEARVVSTADVVSAPMAGDRAEKPAGSGKGAQADPSASGLSLVGANLAIERDVSRLAVDATASESYRTIAAGMYAVAAAVVLGGVVARSRARRDKGKAMKKARLRSFRRTIESARSQSPREAAEQIAHVMRQLLGDCDAVARREADHLVLECENAIFAIGDNSTLDVRGVADRALGIVDRL
ncbi:MAG: protein BatD, partial [Planctomycetes bacterium]|nr:protein BatD [Planctomycetota bacterium]